MFEFLRRKNAPAPEPDGEIKALNAAAPEAPDEPDVDQVLKGAVEALLVDEAIPEPELEAEPEREPEPDFGTVNVIDSGTRIDGSLSTLAAVHLLGEIDGAVECVSLTVEEHAGVRGDVTAAADVVVRGKIVGDLLVDGKLTIAETGSVAGIVRARSLAIEEGAELSGRMMPMPVS